LTCSHSSCILFSLRLLARSLSGSYISHRAVGNNSLGHGT
jgi:hypothetical protein